MVDVDPRFGCGRARASERVRERIAKRVRNSGGRLASSARTSVSQSRAGLRSEQQVKSEEEVSIRSPIRGSEMAVRR